MRKHQTTFSEIVKGRCDFAGIKDQKTLAKKTGMSEKTITRHLRDGDWSRDQLHELHRFLHFEPEDMLVYLEEGR